MVRRGFQGVALLLVAALGTACLGGQTGQPGGSASCQTDSVTADSPWNGTTVAAALRTFSGPYTAPLQWQAQPLADTPNSLVNFQDMLTLSVDSTDASAQVVCNSTLKATVTVTLSTSASGIAESGPGTLEVSSNGRSALLRYSSLKVQLYANLAPTGDGTPPSGGFDALDAQLPGQSARFGGAP